jgi:rRNA-processing protein FCF1
LNTSLHLKRKAKREGCREEGKEEAREAIRSIASQQLAVCTNDAVQHNQPTMTVRSPA